MIAKLEWTHSNAQQNIEQLQNLTMAVTINYESTAIEPLCERDIRTQTKKHT